MSVAPLLAKPEPQGLLTNQTLHTLDIGRCEIGDEGATILGIYLKSGRGNLKILLCAGNNIGAQGAAALGAALPANTTLRVLDMNGNRIKEEGSKALADAFRSNHSLEELILKGTNIGAEGAMRFGEILPVNTGLKVLDLSQGNLSEPLGAKGVVALALGLQQNKSLISLKLRWTKFEAAGGIALAEALEMNDSLVELNIERNKFGDEAANRFAEAIALNTTLKTLHASGPTGVSVEAKKRLLSAWGTRGALDIGMIHLTETTSIIRAAICQGQDVDTVLASLAQ